MTPTTATASLDYDFGLRNERLREDGDKLVISGIASNWDVDREGDQVARYAFDRALKRYLTTNPILLYSHRYSMPMGKVNRAEVRDDGLFVEAELPKPEPGTEAANVWRLVKQGIVRAFSIGGRFHRKAVNGARTIFDMDLREISIAPVGVNAGTLFSVQAGKAFGDPIDGDLTAVSNRLAALRLKRAVGDFETERRLAEYDAGRARLGLL